ncbi:MAG: methyltransferase [Candidatus Yonathbacteria bacterium]|nr:methyltransferase [Candidatus Yonathbacteria bacterium]
MLSESEQNTTRLLTEKYSGRETPEYFADVERLKAGEPYAYVLGYEDFLGARVDLSHKPMIPRPETAHWVLQAIEELRKKGNAPLRVIDLFSGSGNIGLGLLKNHPNVFVEFSEIDANLSEQILKSVRLSNFDESRVKIFAGDALQGMTGEYDAIFANPPYIAPEAKNELDPEMSFEPELAFFGDNSGLYHHELLIEKAWDFLKPGGAVYMEADEDQRPAIEAMLKNTSAPKWTYEFWSDQYGQVRFPVLRKII